MRFSGACRKGTLSGYDGSGFGVLEGYGGFKVSESPSPVHAGLLLLRSSGRAEVVPGNLALVSEQAWRTEPVLACPSAFDMLTAADLPILQIPRVPSSHAFDKQVDQQSKTEIAQNHRFGHRT